MTNIRLTPFEINQICLTFRQFFHPEDHIWLFGSRADILKKGGDIDLYIETHYQDADQVIQARLGFLVALKAAIGDQKIDIVIKFKDQESLIHQIAKQEGVQLI